MTMKRIFASLLLLGVLTGFGLAQTPAMPPPAALPADATPEQLRAEVLAVHDIVCGDVHHAAQILSRTGTLASAIPVVVELTGLQPAEIEGMEAEVCRSDLSALSFEELRASNRLAVWLLDVHLTAMDQVMGR